jgi:hypothetical protein
MQAQACLLLRRRLAHSETAPNWPRLICRAGEQIAGAAACRAQARLTADEEAAAVAGLTGAAAGGTDLLADRAGIVLGFGAWWRSAFHPDGAMPSPAW